MNKNQILYDPCAFSEDQLYDAIREGVVTFEELCSTGDGFPQSLRKRLRLRLSGMEDEDWAVVSDSTDISTIRRFITSHPNSTHLQDAELLIEKLVREAELERIREQDKNEWDEVSHFDLVSVSNFILSHPHSSFRREAEDIKQRLIKELDSEKWDKVNKASKESLSSFISQNPESAFIDDAKMMLNKLANQPTLVKLLAHISKIRNSKEGEDKISASVLKEVRAFLQFSQALKEEFLSYLKEHLNLLNQYEVLSLYKDNTLTRTDLENLTDDDFIDMLLSESEEEELPDTLSVQPIKRVSTEFYFWGGPGSGKTCLMAALLNAAKSGGEGNSAKALRQEKCDSGEYMSKLKNYFNGDGVITLMERTHSDNISAMEFALNDGKKEHPITFVDMPGERLADMYHIRNNKKISERNEEQMKKLVTLLKGNNTNHKIHFFVVEYGAEQKINKNTGVPQSDLLEYAAAYIDELGLFKKESDLVFIIITKADLAPAGTNFATYLSDNYSGFCTNLKKICEDNDINGGEVMCKDFSIGEVVFQKYARFNKADALEILSVIIDRTWKQKGFIANLLSR